MFSLCILHKEFYLLQHLNTLCQSLIEICACKMQGLRVLREEFYFLQCSKHTLLIVELILALEICNVFAFYSYLNTLLWNLSFKKIMCQIWVNYVRSKCNMNTLTWVEWNKRLIKYMLIYILVFHHNTRRTSEDENVKSQLLYAGTAAIKELVK